MVGQQLETIPTIRHCGLPVVKVKMADTSSCPKHSMTKEEYITLAGSSYQSRSAQLLRSVTYDHLECTCRPVTILNCQSCNWSRRA